MCDLEQRIDIIQIDLPKFEYISRFWVQSREVEVGVGLFLLSLLFDILNNMANATRGEDYSTQHLSQRYYFHDSNMDLFLVGAIGWGPAGGLSIGEAFYVASQIADGDADSWSRAFESQGIAQSMQADVWQRRGAIQAAGEMRLKAFACYRMAWQFVAPGERFTALYRAHEKLFDQAMIQLSFPVTRFAVSYGGGKLPDRFLSQGRYLFERGYSIALVDLPGQGIFQEQGLHWEPAVEKPIAAVIDELIASFGVKPRKLALLGMSIGVYFACRAAAHEPRLAAVIATTPLPHPLELFEKVAKQDAEATVSQAAQKNREVILWKAGVSDLSELAQRWEGMIADPKKVHMPFLSVLGEQEGQVWKDQAQE
ncbi:Alpha/Beta hydrolase protein [Talaromyces proteolyticus]|uniref:Alpha/Beta hydrolase protein n=1 Tax=Talaromyces proteolyticus TaxID=1131652 RepID=A0AAD4KCT6_9EURO|nr:Alpha/Beta hydrolase protein [Talaromyces proteolyticus]KAH8688778.1 Alpha/Beta hydrolase protein [Talaromyces proteolyticus]